MSLASLAGYRSGGRRDTDPSGRPASGQCPAGHRRSARPDSIDRAPRAGDRQGNSNCAFADEDGNPQSLRKIHKGSIGHAARGLDAGNDHRTPCGAEDIKGRIKFRFRGSRAGMNLQAVRRRHVFRSDVHMHDINRHFDDDAPIRPVVAFLIAIARMLEIRLHVGNSHRPLCARRGHRELSKRP